METDMIIKELMSLKLSVADRLVGTLPKPVRKRIENTRNIIVKIVHDVSGEYLKIHHPESKERTHDSGLKKVTID